MIRYKDWTENDWRRKKFVFVWIYRATSEKLAESKTHLMSNKCVQRQFSFLNRSDWLMRLKKHLYISLSICHFYPASAVKLWLGQHFVTDSFFARPLVVTHYHQKRLFITRLSNHSWLHWIWQITCHCRLSSHDGATVSSCIGELWEMWFYATHWDGYILIPFTSHDR